MNQPWDPDFTLDHSAVTALARRCGLQGSPVPLGAGWDYATFVCGDMVIRIPKRRATAKLLTDELELLLGLPDNLPLLAPRPRNELFAVDEIPYPAMVYPLLDGVQLCALPHALRVDATLIGLQLGGFLRSLHALPSGVAPRPFSFDEWTMFAQGHLGTIGEYGDHRLTNTLRHLLEQPLPVLDSLQVFCHMDLNDEHILIDTQSSQATAVIDWGDAGAGPWWFDFTGLWLWGDSAALDAALSAYGLSLSTNEIAWFRRHALIVSIGALYCELRIDPESETTRTWRARLGRSMHAAGR